MHKAVCSSCGKECEVPFKPTEGRPVFCKDCYMSQKGEFRRDGPRDRPNREQAPKQDDDVKEQFEEETGETSAEGSEESEDFGEAPEEE